MKNRFKLILLLALTSIMSCSSGDSDDEASANLTMDIGTAEALLIPASTFSCEEVAKGAITGSGSVSKHYFRLPTPNIVWNGDKADSEIRIVLLNFKIESPLLKHECTLSGASLGILFYKATPDANGVVTVTLWDQKLGLDAAKGTLAPFTTKELSNSTNKYTSCEIICGGVSIPEGTGRFTVKGTWEMFGVQRKYTTDRATYEEFPLKITGDFSVKNVLD